MILLDDTDYIVDRFHIKGHVNPKCDIESRDCEFHPDLPTFSVIASGNTECTEQCFSFLRRFGHMMSIWGRTNTCFFFANHCTSKKQGYRAKEDETSELILYNSINSLVSSCFKFA